MTDELEKIENKVKKAFDGIEDKPLTYFIKWAIIAYIVFWGIRNVRKIFKD